jgi:hypothetical protein
MFSSFSSCEITITGLGNLAARWPRHILEAVEEQNKQQGDEGYISLASTPVSPSMTSVPADTEAKSTDVDLKAKPSAAEKEGVDAESPKTAMDLAKRRKEPVVHTIRGITVPTKPSPPGPEGEPVICLHTSDKSTEISDGFDRLLHVRMRSLRL